MNETFGNYWIGSKKDSIFSVESALNIGKSIGIYLKTKDVMKPTVTVSKDTGLYSQMIYEALAVGLISSGVDVIKLDVAPIGALSLITSRKLSSMGIGVLSNKRWNSNRIYFLDRNGQYVDEDVMDIIRNFVCTEQEIKDESDIGKAIYYEYKKEYIEHIKSKIDFNSIDKSRRVVIDFANGALVDFGEELFKSISDPIFLGNKPDGKNIFQSSSIENSSLIKNKIIEQNAELGISFDEAGKTLSITTKQGKTITGGGIAIIIAKMLRYDQILFSEKDSVILEKYLSKEKINCKREKDIYNNIKDTDIALNGEKIILPTYLSIEDSLYGAVMILKLMNKKAIFEEIAKKIPTYFKLGIVLNEDKKDEEILKDNERLNLVIIRAKKQIKKSSHIDVSILDGEIKITSEAKDKKTAYESGLMMVQFIRIGVKHFLK